MTMPWMSIALSKSRMVVSLPPPMFADELKARVSLLRATFDAHVAAADLRRAAGGEALAEEPEQ